MSKKQDMAGWHYVVMDATSYGFGHMTLAYFSFRGHAEKFAQQFENTTVHTVPGLRKELRDLPRRMREYNKQQAAIKTNDNIRVHDEVYIEDEEWNEDR